MANERLQKLQEMLAEKPDDAFLLYGVAMEIKKEDRHQDALDQFDRVIAVDPGYCYAYYQKGLVYEEMGRINDAKAAYQQGIDKAEEKQDAHAKSELSAAMELLG